MHQGKIIGNMQGNNILQARRNGEKLLRVKETVTCGVAGGPRPMVNFGCLEERRK